MEIRKVKQEHKFKLAKLLEEDYGVKINPMSLFDMQVRNLDHLRIDILKI